jgi:hypothetical protein
VSAGQPQGYSISTMATFDPSRYGPVIAELLKEDRLAPLGPGSPNRAMRPKLETFRPEQAFAPHPVRDGDMATACHAALWLHHDFLDESHTISQGLHTPEGSYWHALMHRREPDFANSAYWFRRVGTHPVFEPLRAEAARLAAEGPAQAAFLARQTTWDPFAFVDLCEASYDEKAPGHKLCRQVQRVEWELLFDYCFHAALGRDWQAPRE